MADDEGAAPPMTDDTPNVIDLFSRDRLGGKSNGVHHILATAKKSDKGAILPILANVNLILRHDPALAGMLAHNDHAAEPVIVRAPPPQEDGDEPVAGPYPRRWTEADIAAITCYMQRTWATRFVSKTTREAMILEATRVSFHPIRDWLAGLVWDGTQRIDTWLTKAFGAPAEPYHETVGAKLLIAAVRRARQPGVKFDTMPVFEGPQGIKKSTAIAALFGDAWFSDSMPPDLANRDAALALQGVWCMEFPEVDHLNRNEVEVIKGFLARRVDRIRPPYGHGFVTFHRQGVIWGSANRDDYLRDSTGNRRFWPIQCLFADVDWITENRDQLWAEACLREASREVIYLDDADVQQTALDTQESRLTEDSWTTPIADWLRGRTETQVHDVMAQALQIPTGAHRKIDQMRVAEILRSLGWTRHLARRDGIRIRIWIASGTL